ncbi:hypothetical protein [Streptomyces sp. ISL-86]|uniref:hypothetical protein n=1 Tax=Streptomyces sp. ISL-86 TaxID=2819187 RepID=UPI001BE715DF|nr:hypothetical protein [Streptomyces sp. ISL-86]MBT2458808.1 hypothetical protein [Streptomyces sp. ISL-86]
MPEEWAYGLVNCILYQAMFTGGPSELDEELVRRYAVAMQVEPVCDKPMAAQVAALRAVVAADTALAASFEPYPGCRHYEEAEFRDFLSRLADELESHGPWPTAPAPRRRPRRRFRLLRARRG